MRLLAALPLLLTGLIAGCAAPGDTGDPGNTTKTEPRAQTETPDRGWRWESYGGIELQVPEAYEWNTSGSPLYPAWCAFTGDEESPVPAVNRVRGQAVPSIGCTPERPVSTYAPAVDLDSDQRVGTVRLDGGWVSETVEVAGVKVTVSDDDAARRKRILRSIRPIGETDVHGCRPGTDLVRPGERPSSSAPAADDVTSVAICRYAVPNRVQPEGPAQPLVSSSRLSGAVAAELVRALVAAPEGTGPNSPENCAPEVALGDEVVVLRIGSSRGLHEVVVRYSGCVGNGTDDGTTTRRSTSDVLNAVLTGPNQPTSLQGNVAALLDW
ncbi:MAG TPA: hypothetical protein VFX33_03475, partial [Actinomycetales bacterium]|nr:hypothetical protein [Actinomycetales bacterium]